jgi:hypothetical protein
LDELREDVRSGRDDAFLVSSLIGDGLLMVEGAASLKANDFERLFPEERPTRWMMVMLRQ